MVDIKKAPLQKPTKVTLKRDGYKFTASWQVPSDMRSSSRDDRYEHIYWTWRVNEHGVAKTKDPAEAEHRDNIRHLADTLNINNWESTRPNGKKFTRESFYPYTSKKLDSIIVTVKGHNSFGFSKAAGDAYKFGLPLKPSVNVSYNYQNGHVTVTVTSDAGKGARERARTMVRIVAAKTSSNNRVSEKTIVKWKAVTSTKWTKTLDIGTPSDIGGLTPNFSNGDTLKVQAWAYCQGFHGDNPSKEHAETDKVLIAYPKKATIDAKNIKATSKSADSGRVRIPITVGKYTSTIQLERRHGGEGESWEDVNGAVDDGQAIALYDSVGEANPVRGEKIYYRVKSMRGNFVTYSDAEWAKTLFTALPSVGSSTAGIVSKTPSADGTSCEVVIGWNETEPWTGTELSWSTNAAAWQSTKPPETFEATWKDSTSKSQSWGNTMTITMMDLTAGETYYIRARRYLESDVGTRYTAYSTSDNFTTSAEPNPSSQQEQDTELGMVALSAPEYVVRGEAIPLTWTSSSVQQQTAYAVHPSGRPKVSLVSGRGSVGSAKIPPSKYAGMESVTAYVDVTYPSGAVSSAPVTIGIEEQPDCIVGVADTITAKADASFEVYSTGTPSRVTYVVSADPDNGGITNYTPDGSRDQLKGDAVATGGVTPAWQEVNWSTTLYHAQLQSEVTRITAEVAEAQATVDGMEETDEGYATAVAELEVAEEQLTAAQAALAANTGTINMCTVPIPAETNLVDGAVYQIEASTVNQESGFASENSRARFVVSWQHQAVAPSDEISVAVDETARTATITLEPSPYHIQGDVYDLYRSNGDGYDLIAASLALDAVVTDRWAPFGYSYYRVCTRTVDGDMAWADYSYSLPVQKVRFDWQGGSCELEPHNLATNDSWKKQFEARTHIDGTVNGYWRQGVQRSGSISSTIIMPYEDEANAALRQMADYAGPCMCRTPDGQAYQCDAEVSMGGSHRSPLVSASMSVSKVQLTSDFMPQNGDVAGTIIDGGGE